MRQKDDYGEYVRIWNVVVMAYLKLLFEERNHRKPQPE
jgi:hypothetical protein